MFLSQWNNLTQRQHLMLLILEIECYSHIMRGWLGLAWRLLSWHTSSVSCWRWWNSNRSTGLWRSVATPAIRYVGWFGRFKVFGIKNSTHRAGGEKCESREPGMSESGGRLEFGIIGQWHRNVLNNGNRFCCNATKGRWAKDLLERVS